VLEGHALCEVLAHVQPEYIVSAQKVSRAWRRAAACPMTWRSRVPAPLLELAMALREEEEDIMREYGPARACSLQLLRAVYGGSNLLLNAALLERANHSGAWVRLPVELRL
jgi:hypothetical protein